MYRALFVVVALTMMLPSAPSFAVSAKDKMATCKFGADLQKIRGPARVTFLKRCMMNRNDPRGPAPSSASGGSAMPLKPHN